MGRFIYPWCSAGALRARSSAKKGDVVQTVAQEQMRTKTFKTYSYHRNVSWRIVVTRHFQTLGTLCARSATRNRTRMKTDVEKKIMVGWKMEKECRKKEAAKRLFMTNVTGPLLARFLVIFTQRCVLSGAPRAALCGIGLFLVRFCGNFFFKVRCCGFQSPSMR